MLLESLSLGTHFLLNNQKLEGNFQYEYNFLTGEYTNDDNQVRQAGALWGMSTIHQIDYSADTRKAVVDGLEFFYANSNTSGDLRWIEYPGDSNGSSGTVALVALALEDLLDTDVYLAERDAYETQLDEYINFLLSLRRSDGLFYGNYDFVTGTGTGDPSPYYDGEILLALSKYARNFDHSELASRLTASATAMHEKHVTEALEENADSDETKGFYQWGSMAFYELYNSDWTDDDYAKWTIDMAYWMVDTHRVLDRSRNTAYAYEGLISAYALAKQTDNKLAEVRLKKVINDGLYELTSWQVGNSIQNEYLQENETDDPLAVGGVMNSKAEPTLRIDVAQHQMHAMILALKAFF